MIRYFTLLLGLFLISIVSVGDAQQVSQPAPINNVPTNTALLSATTAAFPNGVWRNTFGNGNGAPPLFYQPSGNACTLNAGNGDNGGQVKSGDGKCWLAQFPHPYDIRQWGADRSGGSNTSAAVQAAFTAVCAATAVGGTVVFPAGTFKIHDVNAPCAPTIRGAGPGGIDQANSNQGTTVDCSGMTAYCLLLGQTATLPNRMTGGAIRDLRFINVTGIGAGIYVRQGYKTTIDNIWFEAPNNAIKVYGSQNTYVSNVILGTLYRRATGVGIEIYGDNAGVAIGGGACAAGDCSTRTDVTWLQNVNGVGDPATGIQVYIHDQAYATYGEQMTWEGGFTGIKVRCAAGGQIGACPQQIRFTRYENEFGRFPVDLQDFTWFKCDNCYLAGENDGGGIATNTISAKLVNYTQSAGGGGGFVLTNSEVFGANNSCLYLGVTDVTVTNSQIFGCNLSSSSSPRYASIQLNAGEQATISNNQFCQSMGAANTPQLGVLIDSGYNRVTLNGNTYVNCTANQANNSAVPASVYESNPTPPPAFGVVSAISGCGTGCTVAGAGGNQLAGLILMTTGASGAAATGSFTLSLPQPMYPQAICGFQPVQGGSASWATGATTIVTPTVSSVKLDWSNAGTPLTASKGYFLNYACRGF